MLGRGYLGMDGLRPDNNIGSTATRLVIDPYGGFGSTPGGMTACSYADNPSRPGFECFFKYGGYSESPIALVMYGGSFAGWSGQSGTTSYHSLLDDFGFNDRYR